MNDRDDLPGALADVVEALQLSTTAHLHLMERRLIADARTAVVAALGWAAGICAALVAWGCAHIALAAWLRSTQGPVVAAMVASAIHAVSAFAIFAAARAFQKNRSLALPQEKT